MELFELTRRLIDIDSVTNRERAVGEFLLDYLAELAGRTGGQLERMEVAPDRFNVLAWWGEPVVTLSTHMDVVPPFFASREDGESIYGRGACDAKGILAAMIKALEGLLEEGRRGVALLVVVGEERNSAGALKAARERRGSRYLINGEPTENKLALGSKGALRYEVAARGRMAHSAFPELGESAIDKLLEALEAIRRIPLPEDAVLGASSLNIGTISGGRAPNVIADEARAEIMFRLVADAAPIRQAVQRAVAGRAEAREVLMCPVVRLRAREGFETTVAPFTTDIPAFDGAWGEPFLIGPGSARVAHTLEESISKRELLEAVEIYRRMVKDLYAETN
jgi:acetylornithine deacetylase